MKEYAEKFYKSKAWQACRSMIWQRDRGLCVDCLARGIVTAAEEVHHIKPITPKNIDQPEITLNPDNLICLCKECHKASHANREPKRYRVSKSGKVETR